MRSGERGSLLMEVLLATVLVGMVIGVAAQALRVSLVGGKTAAQGAQMSSLAADLLGSVRAAGFGNWQNLQALAPGADHHYRLDLSNPTTVALASGDEVLSVDGISYTRFFTIAPVSRDPVSGAMEDVYHAEYQDPSTFRIESMVQLNAHAVSQVGYVIRWRTATCQQTDWTTISMEPQLRTSTSYESASNIVTGAAVLLAPLGGSYPETGELYSGVIDATGIASGAAYQSILWRGTLGGPEQNQGKVRFQLATSVEAGGPWIFVGGPTCTPGDWFNAVTPNVSVPIGCQEFFREHRYFRYRLQLCADDCLNPSSFTPSVSDVALLISP